MRWVTLEKKGAAGVELLLAEIDRIIDGDRYPLSRRIRALREIRALLKPYPERPPLPPRQYEPPSRGAV